MCNGRIKGLVEDLEIEISLDLLRLGDLRWWNKRLRMDFVVWVGRRLTAWYKLKGSKHEVIWCKAHRKYNLRKGEQDKFKCRIKVVSVYPDVEADEYALVRAILSYW